MSERFKSLEFKIREYKSSDCSKIAKLFYDTVHLINAKDYSIDEINSWATGDVDIIEWDKSFLEHYTIVAVDRKDIILGFGDIDDSGYLDRLYVHKDYQNKYIATAICDKLEKNCNTDIITTHTSITAKPFFENRGYTIIKKQQVERNGILLTNYIMQKTLKNHS